MQSTIVLPCQFHEKYCTLNMFEVCISVFISRNFLKINFPFWTHWNKEVFPPKKRMGKNDFKMHGSRPIVCQGNSVKFNALSDVQNIDGIIHGLKKTGFPASPLQLASLSLCHIQSVFFYYLKWAFNFILRNSLEPIKSSSL